MLAPSFYASFVAQHSRPSDFYTSVWEDATQTIVSRVEQPHLHISFNRKCVRLSIQCGIQKFIVYPFFPLLPDVVVPENMKSELDKCFRRERTFQGGASFHNQGRLQPKDQFRCDSLQKKRKVPIFIECRKEAGVSSLIPFGDCS